MRNFLLGRPFGWILALYYLSTLIMFFTIMVGEFGILGRFGRSIVYSQTFIYYFALYEFIWIALSCLIIPLSIGRGMLLFRIKGFAMSHLAYFVLNLVLLLVLTFHLLVFISCSQGVCF